MEKQKLPAVYILASRYRGTLYVGVTSELYNRVHNHKNELHDGFTKKYQIKLLVWYAHLPDMDNAIRAEKQFKAWKRQWKIELVERLNPEWHDLREDIDGNLMYSAPKRGPSFRWDDGGIR